MVMVVTYFCTCLKTSHKKISDERQKHIPFPHEGMKIPDVSTHPHPPTQSYTQASPLQPFPHTTLAEDGGEIVHVSHTLYRALADDP